MSEEKSLVSFESLESGEMILADQSLLKDTASGEGFLPYLQLFTTKSDAVAEGKINGGEYGLVRDGNITTLGKNLDVVVLTVRARAFQKEDSGEITIVHDREDPEYIRIQSLQAESVQGCMAGPEFLIWIPSEKTFATFFCGSKTLKRESRKLGPFLGGKACNLRSKLIDTGKYKWHGPLINSCSTPPSVMPVGNVEEVVQRFKNPPKQKKGEKVEETVVEDVER